MEGLRKLEEVQRTILLMQSEGFMSSSNNSSNDPDSDRFLSNFILLLIHPCGGLDVEKKCQLIYANLPKLSAVFAEEAMPCLTEEGNCENKSDFGALQTDYEDMAMVGLGAMQDANSTLEDFLDRLNEKLVKLPTEGVKGLEQGFHVGANRSRVIKFIELFKTNPFKPLILLLEHHGLFTEQIREEFRCGEEYWRLERMLCGALTSNKKIEVEDVMRAVHLKSFDYRVLNLLLYQLRSVKVDEVHMEFLSVSEFLVELSDDLFDYEDDVLENNFNVLRMFVGIHGASEAPTMLAKCISDAEKKYDRLLKALDPNLSSNYQKRCEEATKEGGKTSGPSLGTWSIPPVIEDEDFYRSKILHSN
ncbi:hypothetical protein RHGRI_022396 [Rhododendron griersonianum]|uniref:Uncharacterized protein n=1 Tax=Rhododendron griersonianum TaxID=479676 RepID=A0AAV6J491_9ERIC|nr:hypothetical protein RHGRI_022396 [Rhododendron griersonianum]